MNRFFCRLWGVAASICKPSRGGKGGRRRQCGRKDLFFLGSTYSTFAVPGAVSRGAFGIDGANIVGVYYNGAKVDGFLYNGSTYTTLDVPGSAYTIASGISGADIVGWYNNGTRNFGFLYDGSTYTTIDVPGATETHAFGVSGNNIVVLADFPIGFPVSYIYDGTTVTPFSAPGYQVTMAQGISGIDVVGQYYNSSTVPEPSTIPAPPFPHINLRLAR